MNSAIRTSPKTNRDKRVDKARSLYPDSWRRVRSMCRWAPEGFDLDDHAARVVLAAREGRT